MEATLQEPGRRDLRRSGHGPEDTGGPDGVTAALVHAAATLGLLGATTLTLVLARLRRHPASTRHTTPADRTPAAQQQ
jgi:hypothetical protein